MDVVLQAERLDGRTKRTHAMAYADLPDGAVVAIDGAAYAVRGSHLLRWSENGYTDRIARPRGNAMVLTPPSIVAVLKAGYRPQWHPSVDNIAARPRESGDPEPETKRTGFPLSRE
jgi:hypothetical protein